MNKLIVVNWIAGTAGDLVTALLSTNSSFRAGTKNFAVNSAGRVSVDYDNEILQLFPKQPKTHWYNRDWGNDLDKLSQLPYDFIIQTTSEQQLIKLKNHFGSNITTISISYDTNLKFCVLKNFCSKVLDSDDYLTKDDVGENFLNAVSKTEQQRQQFINLGKNRKLGEWYFKHYLENALSYPPEKFSTPSDVNLNLDNILNETKFSTELKNLNNIVDFEYNTALSFYQSWIKLQDPLYTAPSNYKYKDLLGYNKTFNISDHHFLPDTTSAFNDLLIQNKSNLITI
jgi:hypothetical protein